MESIDTRREEEGCCSVAPEAMLLLLLLLLPFNFCCGCCVKEFILSDTVERDLLLSSSMVYHEREWNEAKSNSRNRGPQKNERAW
jgi:hypothetical protein